VFFSHKTERAKKIGLGDYHGRIDLAEFRQTEAVRIGWQLVATLQPASFCYRPPTHIVSRSSGGVGIPSERARIGGADGRLFLGEKRLFLATGGVDAVGST